MTLRKFRAVLCLSLAASIAVPSLALAKGKSNRSMDSVNQPVVTYSTFIYDVQGDGALSSAERVRLGGWLGSINIGYGDHIAIATEDAYVAPAMREGVGEVVGHYGLLLEEDSTAQAGKAPSGTVRLILRRATASVPNCPNWSRNTETDSANGLYPGYGCAVNGMLAAMIANPEDLVRGQTGSIDLNTATSNRAIEIHRAKTPTGAGGLQSAGGN